MEPPSRWLTFGAPISRPYLSSRSACSILTCFQSISNSSATIMGSELRIPCPVSGFFAMIVNVLSG